MGGGNIEETKKKWRSLMKSKKLIRNVLGMLVILMAAVMVLSGCGNAAGSEHANIAIRLGESRSERAISAAEKASATFNIYFNDSLVASNVGTSYNGTAQVGTRLHVRVDAFVNGKRIARSENTITVRNGNNSVSITLTENREELKPPVGSIIMKDGSYLTKEQITPENQSDAVAVVFKAEGGKAWAVGKVLSDDMRWAITSSQGRINIVNLQSEQGYTDGSTGLDILRTVVNDADDANLATNYPAWDYACNYGRNQGLDNFQTGWYLPSKEELQIVFEKKTEIETALVKTGVTKTSFENKRYWSSSQLATTDGHAYCVNSSVPQGYADKSTNSGVSVCAVRQFTY